MVMVAAKLRPGIHLSTVKRDDAIPRSHTGLGSRCTTVFLGAWAAGLGGMGAGGDCSDCRRLVGSSVNAENRPEQQEGQQQIGKNPTAHDDEALPHRLVTEKPTLVGVCDAFDLSNTRLISKSGKPIAVTMVDLGGVHPDEAHIATQRDPFEPVLRLTARERPDLRSEPGKELGDLDPEDLRRDEVTAFME